MKLKLKKSVLFRPSRFAFLNLSEQSVNGLAALPLSVDNGEHLEELGLLRVISRKDEVHFLRALLLSKVSQEHEGRFGEGIDVGVSKVNEEFVGLFVKDARESPIALNTQETSSRVNVIRLKILGLDSHEFAQILSFHFCRLVLFSGDGILRW